MQLVNSSDVREGFVIAKDVHDPGGRILLVRGQRMTSTLIKRLHKFQIHSVYLRDGYGEDERDLIRAEVKRRCEQVLARSFENAIAEAESRRLVVDQDAIRMVGETLLEALLAAKDPLVNLLDISSSGDRLMQHSVNATVLATLMGIDLKLSTPMLRELAMGMLFHDIGLTLLPDELTQKQGHLTRDEVTELRSHPALGFEHLSRSGAVSKIAANIVLRHHEAMNGSGYPQRVTGDKLTLLTRLAAVAEVYDSLTSIRFGQPAVMPDSALSYIITNTGNNKLFAREATLALCRRVALYPAGTAVQVNTGESGIVAKTEAAAPTRPLITIHFNHRGARCKPPIPLDLMQDHARFVVRSAPSLSILNSKGSSPAAHPKVDPILAAL